MSGSMLLCVPLCGLALSFRRFDSDVNGPVFFDPALGLFAGRQEMKGLVIGTLPRLARGKR
jgi:hypothetical protein